MKITQSTIFNCVTKKKGDHKMRKLIYSLVFVLVIGLTISTSGLVLAQQQDQGPGQGGPNQQNRQQRPQMDPEAMIKQMLTRITEQLKLSDDESKVITPMIENILRTRMTQNQANRELMNSLRTIINAKDIEATKKTDQIKSKLAELKAKRKENKEKSEAMEKELIELLTPDQEAILTVSGIVNSDGSGFGGFGGFGGPGGPGGNRGPGNQGNQGGNPPQPPQGQ
jgi:hypothetical protein